VLIGLRSRLPDCRKILPVLHPQNYATIELGVVPLDPRDKQLSPWETVIAGRRVESLPVLQEAIYGMESRLGLGGEGADILKKRGQTEIRLDSGWGKWADHHLAARARVSGDRQVQIRRPGAKVGAWDQQERGPERAEIQFEGGQTR
jgi:hypothetical protein